MKAELLTKNFKSDLTIVNAARVSFGKERSEFDNSDESGSDKRMTKYLVNAKPVPHFAPMCHARETFVFDINEFKYHELTETDSAGMVTTEYFDNEFETDPFIKCRHSLFGWANLLNKDYLSEDVANSINAKLSLLYPKSWVLLYNKNVQLTMVGGSCEYIEPDNETDPRFIDVSFRMKAMIPVVRQWYKAKVGRIESEESRRYIFDMPSFHYIEEWSDKPKGSIKQGAGDKSKNQWLPKLLQRINIGISLSSYWLLIKLGYAPEQARVLLPQATEVEWIETASLATYQRILTQRLDSHAQKEIRDLALMVEAELNTKCDKWKL